MTKPFRPMKGEPAPDDLSTLTFPKLVAAKLDGWRLVSRDGVALTNTLKPFRNRHVQALFGRPDLHGLDGEVIVGAPTGGDVINRTTQGVSPVEGEPDVTFWVFDDFSVDGPFHQRFEAMCKRVIALNLPYIKPVLHLIAPDHEAVAMFERQHLDLGYEGVMLRCPNGPYKYGKATVKEGWLLKLKRFVDDEALIIGVKEEMENTNEKVRDARGISKRGSAKNGKVPKGTLGAVICRLADGTEFPAAGGSDARCEELWAMRDELPGKIAKVRYFGRTADGALRHPQFVDLRNDIDNPNLEAAE